MPGDDGLVLLDKLKHVHPGLPVVVMSAYTDVASTAGAFRGGAHEFLSKPFDLDDAVALARRVLAQRDGDDAEMHREPEPAAAPASDALVGDTPAMRQLFRAIGRLAPARSEEHTSELQSLMRISYAVFCLKKKTICRTHL